MDAGFTLNVKGALILELPGPRILLVMKAHILWPKPPRGGNPDATILAVIDIDLGRERITIGLTFEWGIKPLIHIHVPVRAIFPFNDMSNFALDVGTWYAPATVTFFEQFKAHGYFMVRGNGIPNADYDAGHTDFPLGTLSGFSIALGVSVSFTWGSTSIGLYLRMSTAFHVGIGFSPLMFVGTMRISGELHLFIVGIEASAQLTVKANETKTLIDGEARGEIDLFFFSISGSVHVTLGEDPGAGTSVPPPLVQRVTVHSRSAALLSGSGIDRPIDGRLADATSNTNASIPTGEHVPIDSVVVVHLDCIPRVAGGVQLHATPGGAATTVNIGPPPGSASPAVRRGEPYYTYRLTKVTLSPDVTAGEIPLVWWTTKSASDPADPETKIQLALLTRVPSAHPSAIERSKHLTESITDRWSTVCEEVAPATRVLWTFEDQSLGPSTSGWTLVGSAWPDPPGTTRSVAPRLHLDVAETWRTGRPEQDLRKPVAPARVVGGIVPCSRRCGEPPKEPEPERDVFGGIVRAVARRQPDDERELLRLEDLAGVVDLESVAPDIADFLTAGRARAARAAMPAGLDRDWRPPAFEPDDDLAETFQLRASDHRCPARALEAPFRYPAEDPDPDHPLAEAMSALAADLAAAEGSAGDRLEDVVAFSPGATAATRMLLLVPARLLRAGQLVLRAFDPGGAVVDEHRIDGSGVSRLVQQPDDLPPEWLDPDGPWRCDVERVVQLFATFMRGREKRAMVMVLVDTVVPDATLYLHLGIADVHSLLKDGFSRPSYFVGVVDTLSVAELGRADTEQQIRDTEIDTINGALAPLQNPPALLKPNTKYTVAVEWEWATCDAQGTGVGTWTAGTTQQFAFHTDDQPLKPREITSSSGAGQPATAKTMPVRLDGWILVTDPHEDTKHFFYAEPLCVVFAVDYLLDMFAAYGVPLEARVRAASYKNVAPSSPLFPLTGVALTAALQTPLAGAAVFTPWEDTIRGVLCPDAQPCIELSGETIRHTQVHLPLHLEPMTDYVFDIEPTGTTAPPAGTSATPLFRRKFTTSRYAGVPEMCAAVQAAEVRQSPSDATAISDLVALATAATPMAARALDDALRRAGLDPATPVDLPRVEVLWVPDAIGVQPRVIVIRTPEPLVRIRRTPVDYEPPGQPRLDRKVTRLEHRPFLDVIPTPAPAAGPNPTMRVKHAEGGGVLVVVVDQGRGTTVDLTVRRSNDPFLDQVPGVVDSQLLALSFASAPWELLP